MHVGDPLMVSTRCDGDVFRSLQIPGDIKIVPAGYSRIWETEGPTTKLVISLNPSLVKHAACEMGVNPEHVEIAPQVYVRDPLVEHIGWALKAELETDVPAGRVYAEGLGLALAAHLLRRYAPAIPRRIEGGLPKRRLQRVLDHIYVNISGDLSLGELAGVASVSASHFKVLFKQSVGMPVHQYVIRRRVDFATELLLNEEMAPSEVALAAGFANQSHMARCMRRVIGTTPGALARK